MACLLIAGTIYLSEKIKGRNKMKREQKRQAYETRYNELEEEHKQGQLEYTQTRNSVGNNMSETNRSVPDDHVARRTSSQVSIHSQLSSDGPAQWVEKTNKHQFAGRGNNLT